MTGDFQAVKRLVAGRFIILIKKVSKVSKKKAARAEADAARVGDLSCLVSEWLRTRGLVGRRRQLRQLERWLVTS